MKTLQKTLLLLTISVISACNSSSKEEKLNDTITDTTNYISSNTETYEKPTINTAKDSVFTVKFDDITLSINAYIATEDNFSDQIQKDTLHFYLDLEDDYIQDKLITVIQTSLTDLRFEQRFETSFVIHYTEEYYDQLEKWKHYNSEWRDLKMTRDGKYLYQGYSYEKSNIFPNVTVDELKQELLNGNGKDFLKVVDEIKLPFQYPVDNYISGYYLRITGKRNSDGKIITKLLIVTPSYGC